MHDFTANDEEAVMNSLIALAKYNSQWKLQEAVICFIVGQLASKEDMIEIQKAFRILDTNNDGMLSKYEMTVGYQRIYGDAASDEVEKIFEKVDFDGSGFIDYSEWVVATINKEKLLTDHKLMAAFQLFDRDGGGTISAKEVKDILIKGPVGK